MRAEIAQPTAKTIVTQLELVGLIEYMEYRSSS